jgi:hypothetical protein
MASEHILLTKEQFERLKNKRETVDKNTLATQTDIPLQTLPAPLQEYANELKLNEVEKNRKITTPVVLESEINQSNKENKKERKKELDSASGNKVSRKAIGHRKAPISKKLVNSKIFKKEKKNKNSRDKVIAWHRL